MSTVNPPEKTQHFSLGDQQVWILPDIVLQQPASLFAIGGSDSEIAEIVGSPEQPLTFSGCPILLKWSDRTILIDARIGKQDPNVPGMLPQRLAEIGMRPDQISDVLITHLHADHVGGSFDPVTGNLLFPNATYHISEPEIAFWKDPDLSQANRTLRHCSSSQCAPLNARSDACRSGHSLLPRNSFQGSSRYLRLVILVDTQPTF
jgi:glyoxylase-like metal-dependent hydrolase (beta-lactamase superfamily II)